MIISVVPVVVPAIVPVVVSVVSFLGLMGSGVLLVRFCKTAHSRHQRLSSVLAVM